VGRVVENDNDREKLQKDLDRLVEWSGEWQMLFNSGKCKVIHFGRRNNEYSYTMGGYAPAGSVLESVVEKDGVMVHNSLKPSAQCAKAAKKANQLLGQMAWAFHYRDKVTWVRLYKTYVRCHLEYSVQAWCPWTQKDKDVLESVQRRAVRMISGLQSKEYLDRLKEVGLTTLEARRDRGDLIEVWGILHRKKDVDLSTWFRMASEGSHSMRLAGHPLSIFKERSNLEIRSNFFSMRCCDTWNRLPNNIKEAKSINVFKNAYDKYRESFNR
jgi:hypothetical protein